MLRKECVGLAQLANQIEQDIQNDKEVSQSDQSPAQLYEGGSIVQEETLETTRDGGFVDNSTPSVVYRLSQFVLTPQHRRTCKSLHHLKPNMNRKPLTAQHPPHNATSQDEITDIPLTRDTSTVSHVCSNQT